MLPPAIPADEPERLRALLRLQLLDTPRDALFDTIIALAAAVTGASRGAVSLVDRERQWFKAVFGELPSELARNISFCGHAVAHDDTLIVPDARQDPRFSDNPLVVDGTVVFYAGVPLASHDGQPIGTLCVIHGTPLEISGAQLAQLAALAACIESHLDLRLLALRLGGLNRKQEDDREILSDLDRRRDQIVRMGLHDVSSPLTVAYGTAELLLLKPSLPPDAREAVEAIVSATEAATRLMHDLISVARSKDTRLSAQFEPLDLHRIAQAVVRRLRILAAHGGHSLRVESRTADAGVLGDHLLIERMLRNLLDNALKYAREGPIVVELRRHPSGDLQVSVNDAGPAIGPELHEEIFAPGFRASDTSRRSGHGLGLALCREVVELHGGTIAVQADDTGGNRFVVRLPQRSGRGDPGEQQPYARIES